MTTEIKYDVRSTVVIGSTFLPWAESATLRQLGSWVGSSESPDRNAFELAGYIHEVSDGDINLGILLLLFAMPMLVALITLIIGLAGLMVRRWNPASGILSILCRLVMCLISVGLAVAGTALQSDRNLDLSSNQLVVEELRQRLHRDVIVLHCETVGIGRLGGTLHGVPGAVVPPDKVVL
ncbi:MAG: hypothetical protein OXE87_06505 [Chloroflexi bacterium]|nr:hypothetical protein [Chloroflexota bacterium]